MKDPKRLLDDEGTPEEIRRLLDAGDPAPRMKDEAKAAAAAFATNLTAGTAAATAGAGAAAGGTALSTKILVGLVIVGAAATATSVAVQERPDEPTAAVSDERRDGDDDAPIVDLTVRSPMDGPSAELPLPEPPPDDTAVEAPSDPSPEGLRPAVPRPALPDAQAGDPLAAEAALLERARAQLDLSPARALSLVNEHRRSFPAAQLGAERELIAVEALLRLGRRGEARRRAQRLIDRAPDGMYAERLRRMLDSVP